MSDSAVSIEKYSGGIDKETSSETQLLPEVKAFVSALEGVASESHKLRNSLTFVAPKFSVELKNRGTGSVYTTECGDKIISGQASLHDIFSDVDEEEITIPEKTSPSKLRVEILKSILGEDITDIFRPPLNELIARYENTVGHRNLNVAPPPGSLKTAFVETLAEEGKAESLRYVVNAQTNIPGFLYSVEVVCVKSAPERGYVHEYISSEALYRS